MMKAVFFLTLLVSFAVAQDDQNIVSNSTVYECDSEFEECIEVHDGIEEGDLRLWRASYYVMGVVYWMRAFLPLIFHLAFGYTKSTYIAPVTDLVGYLPLAIIWLMTGWDSPHRNKQWILWSKWI